MKTFLRFLLPALMLWSVAYAQDFSQKVTYEAGGVSAKRVIEELSTLTKVPLKVAPLVASEVLVIHVKDVPLSDLMKKLADVTSGEWKQEGEVWWLGASSAKRNAEANAEYQQRLAAVQKALDQLLKPEKPEGEPNNLPGGFAFSVGGGGDPGSKAILTILRQGRITAATLAGIEDGGRIVFSSQPTRMQLPMNFNVQSLARDLVQQHNKHVEALREAEANRPVRSKEEEQMEEFAAMMGFGKKPAPITTNAAKLLLVASKNNFMDGITLQLKMFDERGQVVLTGSQNLMVDMGMFEDFAEMVPGGTPPKAPPADPKDTVIEFSDRSKRLLDFFKTMTNPMMAPKKDTLSKDLMAVLLHPEQDDPLSFIHGEATVAVAKAKNLNVVANLPDSMLSAFGMMFSNKKYMVNAYQKDLESGKETTGETKDGWLTVRPAKPAESRRTRADRMALSQFINLANGKGIPSLDDYAAYALKSEPPMESPASMMYLMFFAPNTINQGFGGMTNWEMLRLYGSLSTSQKQNMAAGGQLGFGSLSPQQRGIVHKLLFGANTKLQVTDVQTEKVEGHPFLEMARAWMPADSREIRDEPTEVMPNGLPQSGFLTMSMDKGHFTMVGEDQSAAPSSMFGAMGADEMAMMRYFKEDPQFSAFANFMPAMDKFRLGERETLTFKFHVAPNVLATEVLKNDKMQKDSAVIAYSQLPSSLRETIEKRVELFKKNPLPFGMMMGGQGGFRPPAP